MNSWQVSDGFGGSVELDTLTGVLRIEGRVSVKTFELTVSQLRELRNAADLALFNLNRKGMTP